MDEKNVIFIPLKFSFFPQIFEYQKATEIFHFEVYENGLLHQTITLEDTKHFH
jgi:hypothetical protein